MCLSSVKLILTLWSALEEAWGAQGCADHSLRTAGIAFKKSHLLPPLYLGSSLAFSALYKSSTVLVSRIPWAPFTLPLYLEYPAQDSFLANIHENVLEFFSCIIKTVLTTPHCDLYYRHLVNTHR